MSFVINYNSKKIPRLTKIVRTKYYFSILLYEIIVLDIKIILYNFYRINFMSRFRDPIDSRNETLYLICSNFLKFSKVSYQISFALSNFPRKSGHIRLLVKHDLNSSYKLVSLMKAYRLAFYISSYSHR